MATHCCEEKNKNAELHLADMKNQQLVNIDKFKIENWKKS